MQLPTGEETKQAGVEFAHTLVQTWCLHKCIPPLRCGQNTSFDHIYSRILSIRAVWKKKRVTEARMLVSPKQENNKEDIEYNLGGV